jgi:RNA polymerase sigma-70 factor (ECF subfamily)
MPPRDPSPRAHAAPVDREFLARVRRRDPAALEQFFDLYYDRLFGHVARLVQDDHLAEDLTHEVFLHLTRVLDRLDPGRDPAGWVFTVATNVVRDHWRSRSHKSKQRDTELKPEHHEVLAAQGDHPEDELKRTQDQELVRRALADLAEADREVILLRDFEQLDTATVAEVIGIKIDAVRQRHSRAVSRLGEAFRRHVDHDGAMR